MAEQIEDYGAPASDADIAAFQNMQQVDINTPAWQPGSRYDTQVRGLTSQDYTQHAPIEAPPRPEEPVYDTSVMPTTPETNWQQLYGRSENEKGELRRMLNEYNATLTATMAELTALRNAQSVNAYPTSPVHAQQPQYQLPETFFPERQPGDVVEVREIDALLRNVVGPTMLTLAQQQQNLFNERVEQEKRAVGINSVVEARLLATRPWLNNIGDPLARVRAMAEIVQAERPVSPTHVPQAPVHPAAAAARRVTFVEPAGGHAAANPQPSREQVLARFKQEFASARTAAEKKAVLGRYGVGVVNDFGPDVLGLPR
jgi:hypothetical protein